jgi:hypothetical protein
VKFWQRLAAASLGAVLVLGLGACGGDDKKSGDSKPAATATTKPADAGQTWHQSGGGIDVTVTQRHCGYDVTVNNTHDSPNYWVLRVNGKKQGGDKHTHVNTLSKKGTKDGSASMQVANTDNRTLIEVRATTPNGTKRSVAFTKEAQDKHCDQ